MGNKFNFADVRKKAVAKAEKELEQGLEQMAEQGGGVAPNRPTPSPSLKWRGVITLRARTL